MMGNNPSQFKGPKNPVEQVSTEDCQKFLDKLNGLPAAGGKFQLPSEAQWEYACRAGTKTRYFFGDDDSKLGENAWFASNANSKSHPVGEKKPNAWRLYDMHGNVWEWCQDWFSDKYYAASPTDDPTGPATGTSRVLRGGSWDTSPRALQVGGPRRHPARGGLLRRGLPRLPYCGGKVRRTGGPKKAGRRRIKITDKQWMRCLPISSSILPMGGFARTCSEVGLPIPCSILPMGGFCPNLPEDSFRSSLIPSFIPHPSFRRVVLARTCPNSFCSSFIPHPSFRWVVLARTCPEIRSAHPSSFIHHPSFRWVVLPELARNSFCSSFIPCIPHPSFRRVVLARTCSKFVLLILHPSSLILPSDGWFSPELARKFGLPSTVRSWLVPNREFGLGRNGGTGGPRRARMLQPGGQFCLSRNHRNLRIRTLRSFPLMILRSGKGHCAFEWQRKPLAGAIDEFARHARRATARPAAEPNCQGTENTCNYL